VGVFAENLEVMRKRNILVAIHGSIKLCGQAIFMRGTGSDIHQKMFSTDLM
jgi:hypothetical protein